MRIAVTAIILLSPGVLAPVLFAAEKVTDKGSAPRLHRLLNALEDPSFKLRLQAAVYLGRLDNLRAVDPLLRHLKEDPQYTVRAACAVALATLEEPRAVPHLLHRMALDANTFVREESQRALATYDRELILPYIVEAFSSGSDGVRLEALRFLAAGPFDAGEFVLQEALGDNSDIRQLALTVVRRAPPEDRMRFLQEAISSRRPSVRAGAVMALGEVKTNAAAALVREVYNRDVEVSEVRDAARVALKGLRPYVDILSIIKIATNKTGTDKHERARAIKSLGVLGGDESKQALLKTLHDKEHYVRGTTVLALRELGDVSVVPELVAMTKDPANKRILENIRTTILFLERAQRNSKKKSNGAAQP